MKIKKVAVIGLGYVGLPTLVAIGEVGKFAVVGFDIDREKIKRIRAGKRRAQRSRIRVSSDERILNKTDVFIICVPTPVRAQNLPDLRFVRAACGSVARYLQPGGHIVIESTVAPGTCRKIVAPLLAEQSGLQSESDFNVAHCPERINPGDKHWTIHNITRNIGSFSPELNHEIADFYRTFVREGKINEVSSLEIAEATKLVESVFRDVNIALVNELAQSFDVLGIDLVQTLAAAANKPFGFMPFWPGAGVGGDCVPTDPIFLIQSARKAGFQHRLLKLARQINTAMPRYVIARLKEGLIEKGIELSAAKVVLLGLSYKPAVADTRNSPGLEIKELLRKQGVEIVAFDPYVNSTAKSLKSVVKDADAVVIATAHAEFVEKLPRLLRDSKVKVVVDGRNCLTKAQVEKMGIVYKGTGR